jgi:hypothetical protein
MLNYYHPDEEGLAKQSTGLAFFSRWNEAENQAKLFTYVGEGGRLIVVS